MNNSLGKTAYKERLNIAAYLRISQDDGEDIESCSITNQRELIMNYVAGREEFSGAAVTDYVDDGLSGSRSDRDSYVRLLADIERGAVDCVVVKDLSRIGRNMIDVDDLLMNRLVTLGVRFIAINNGYDSFSSPLSNLELAVISLANQHYNRDLAVKSMTARNVKSRRGEYLALAPFGYKKSKTEKNRLIPDDEAAGYVRLIFSLAAGGHRTVEIAQILNAQGVPSPSVYKLRNGYGKRWSQAIDPDYCFWTNGVLCKMLKNKVYLGTLVANRQKVTEPGTGRMAPRPEEEWIVVPNAHEPLVPEEDFNKAQLVLQKQRYFGAPGHIFGNKVKCPACGHAMTRYTRSNPRFKCGTVKMTGHYGCKPHTILQSDIEKAVLASIRTFADVMIDGEEMKLARIQKSKLTAKGLENKIHGEQQAIGLLEASVTKIFTSLASGKISKDLFIHKKGVINGAIEKKRLDVEKWQAQLRELLEGRAAAENAIADLNRFRELETLDCEAVDLLIDRILVHDEHDIEIVWKGGFGKPV